MTQHQDLAHNRIKVCRFTVSNVRQATKSISVNPTMVFEVHSRKWMLPWQRVNDLNARENVFHRSLINLIFTGHIEDWFVILVAKNCSDSCCKTAVTAS